VTTKTAILQAIRHKCLDCSVYQPTEVRECPVTTCGLWPFRFGVDPEPSRTRGFAKSPVYTGNSEARDPGGTPVAGNLSPSGIGLQDASFSEREAILAPGEFGPTFADVRPHGLAEGRSDG
jgi:hypothetical protein